MKRKTLHKHFWDATGLISPPSPFVNSVAGTRHTQAAFSARRAAREFGLYLCSYNTINVRFVLAKQFPHMQQGQPSFKSPAEEKICLYFHILTWKIGKKCFCDFCQNWVREHRETFCLTQRLFSFCFPHRSAPNLSRPKSKPLGALCSHFPTFGGISGSAQLRAGPASPAWQQMLWVRPLRHCDGAWQVVVNGLYKACGRAAWQRSVLHCDSLISQVEAVQCIIF